MPKLMSLALLFVSSLSLANTTAEQQVNHVLDQLHQYAAEAKGEAYFALMAEDMVYLGTDASERWSKEDFKGYAMPYFSQGRGWSYTPRYRHIYLSDSGKTAWFDELLINKSYGEVRGSGVLVLTTKGWKFKQYNLAFPIPNNLAKQFTKAIKQQQETGNE